MKTISISLAALFLSLVALTPSFAADSTVTPPEHPFLWRIPGAQVDSWAFGTIHLPDPRVTTMGEAVLTALSQADAIYTEIAFSPEGMREMMQGMALEPGQSLRQLVPAPILERANTELRRINGMLNVQLFDGQKIWVLANGFIPLEQQLKHPQGVVLDQMIWNRGQAQAHTEARALETVDEQLGVFDQLSIEEQVHMLDMTLTQMVAMRQAGRDPVEELVAIYRSGDITKLDGVILEFMDPNDPLSQRLIKSLLDDRNRVMADRMVARLTAEPEKSHFFAVGTAHFMNGPNGLPALLAERGVVMERVEAAQPVLSK